MARHTLRGRVEANTTKRLIIDDGMLNEGHRVTEFTVFSIGLSSSGDPECFLATKDNFTTTQFDASDNRQIGWAIQTTSSGTRVMNFSLLDAAKIVLKDLFIHNRGSDVANYLVVIEPVTLTDDQAVMTLIKERSQDDI